ncbi:stage III sporulation protein AG [Anaerosporobacter faecicola]|uniref:stage III sporulation protein AG n=1 Tax=Anaerosporobacter faecicola TaxID=2718714 RepID=UPI0014392CD2|nr:stage III sporulation protein AG [Anaerosporobacter faecicola]
MEKKKLSLKEIGIPRLLIIGLCGIFLIILSFPNLFSGGDKKTSTTNTQEISQVQSSTSLSYEDEMEQRLQNVLKKVAGIGEVEVMITVKSSKERVTLKDTPYTQETLTETDSAGGSRNSDTIEKQEETVLQNNGSGESTPYVVKELEPEVEGVLVIAQGGDSQTIINEIVDAVEVLFDVPAHKIKVMKMNSK